MIKIKLILVDSDLEYLSRFSRYIRDSEYRRIFSVKLFTDIDLLQRYLENINELSILCFVDDWLMLADIKNKYLTKIILSSRNMVLDEDSTNIVIYKFQPLNLIMAAIYSSYLDKNASHLNNPNKNATKIITITAASGDYHQNEFSLLLAKQLAGMQSKVFYLNLEAVNSLDYFLPISQSYDLSKIIYHLKKQPEKIAAYIEKYKKEESNFIFDYFERVQHINDLFEIDKLDLINLFIGFKKLDIYDYIIVLLDSAVGEPNLTAMSEADYRLMLVGNNQYSFGRALLIEDYLSRSLGEGKINLDYVLVKETDAEQQLGKETNKISFVGYVVGDDRKRELNLVNTGNYFAGLELYLNKFTKQLVNIKEKEESIWRDSM